MFASQPLFREFDHLRRSIRGCDRRVRKSCRQAEREVAGAAAEFENPKSEIRNPKSAAWRKFRRNRGALAGLAACLLVLQYDVHPFVGLSFGPITFLICVLGGLGNMIGGFVAAFLFAIIISLGGLYSDLEWGYVLAFGFFIVMMFIRPAGLLARRS